MTAETPEDRRTQARFLALQGEVDDLRHLTKIHGEETLNRLDRITRLLMDNEPSGDNQ